MSHTPGPWQVETVGDTVFVTQGDRPRSLVSLLQMNGPCVFYNNADNDARLIAAAPDLLKALKVFAEVAARPSVADIVFAREVIAKAEGHS